MAGDVHATIKNPNDNKRKNTSASAARTKTGSLTDSEILLKACPLNDGALEDIEDFGEDEALRIRESLLRWYDHNMRDLPWRRSSSSDILEEEVDSDTRAYEVWVSEVMLQQTRVQTVIDYYNRWMLKWPTLESLSKASLEEVNELWAGLGYYRRARFLLQGAMKIVEIGDGFPNNVSALCKVPGIGNYTAGAIASIAFNKGVPVVDGNVVRVLARLRAVSANPKDSLTIKTFWRLARQLVDPSRPGDFNQALMELGATLCTPLSPSCSTCPLASQCRALRSSHPVTNYPIRVLKPKPRHDHSAICVVEITSDRSKSKSRFVLVRRPDEGLLAGLWEFPSADLSASEAVDLTTRRERINDLFRKKWHDFDSWNVLLREEIGACVHVFTHIRLQMFVELLVLDFTDEMMDEPCRKLEMESSSWKCVDGEAIATMGLSSGVKKVWSMIQEFRKVKSVPAKAQSLKFAKRNKEKRTKTNIKKPPKHL